MRSPPIQIQDAFPLSNSCLTSQIIKLESSLLRPQKTAGKDRKLNDPSHFRGKNRQKPVSQFQSALQMVKVEKKFSIQDGLKISLLAETQVGFQYKAGRVSSVTDLAAFTQSHSPHSRDFRVRRNQAFEPCQVYLPFGTLEEENLKTESLLPSQQSMTFPKKAQIPLMLFALVRQSVSFFIWAERTSKAHSCCQAFPLFHLRSTFPGFSPFLISNSKWQ